MSDIIRLDPAVLGRGEISVCGLIMDRSGSMRRFGREPLAAINEHLRNLKREPQAAQTIGFVMTFADDHRFDLEPQPLADMPELEDYGPQGNTKLYGTVLEALKAMLKLKAQGEAQGTAVRMILAVFTDGEDNKSQNDQRELVKLSGQALEAGAELILVGLGQPAEIIAQGMGFPPDSAVQAAATPEAVRRTMLGVTQRTRMTITGLGVPVRTKTPPSPSPPPSSR